MLSAEGAGSGMKSRNGALGAAILWLGAAPLVALGTARADPQPADGAQPASSQPSDPSADKAAAPDRWWAIHVQATDVFQYKPAMRSPFQGANSLPGRDRPPTTRSTPR